jgi:hypothetical protein
MDSPASDNSITPKRTYRAALLLLLDAAPGLDRSSSIELFNKASECPNPPRLYPPMLAGLKAFAAEAAAVIDWRVTGRIAAFTTAVCISVCVCVGLESVPLSGSSVVPWLLTESLDPHTVTIPSIILTRA